MKNLIVAVAVAVGVSVSASGDIYSWRNIKNNSGEVPPATPDWRSYADSANWAVGEPYYTGENQGESIPGPADDIHFGRYKDYTAKVICLDLAGGTYSAVKLLGGGDQWVPYLMLLKNGTLGFSGSFNNNSTHVHVYDGGRFVHGSGCTSKWGSSGIRTVMHAHDGGQIDIEGNIQYVRMTVIADDGATVTFNPSKIENVLGLVSSHGSSAIRNYGTFNLPDGFVLDAQWSKPDEGTCYFTFEQLGGTLNAGGDFVKTEKTASEAYNLHVNFILAGGTLNAMENVAFTGFRNVVMTNDAVATVNVAAGKTLDLTAMEFAPGTVLTKTGEGTVKFGDSVPETLNIVAGTNELTRAVAFGTVVFSGNGVLHIGKPGVSARKVVAAGNAVMTASEEALTAKAPLLVTGEGTEAEVLAEKLVPPEGFAVVANGGTLTVEPPHESTGFLWKRHSAQEFYRYYDPSSWAVGGDESSPNEGGLIPGENDVIDHGFRYDQYYSFDMQGGTRWVKGLGQCINGNNKWAPFRIKVINGTFGVVSNFTNIHAIVRAHAAGRFVLGENCSARLGKDGNANEYTSYSGGECDIGGDISVNWMKATVNEGGRFVFRPKSLAFDAAAGVDRKSYIGNRGVLELPNGVSMGGASNVGGCAFAINQEAGEMVLGGSIEMTGEKDCLDFLLAGGTVRVISDAAFVGCRSVAMTNGVSAAVDVDDGKTADFSAMEFGEGTALLKSGAGALRLGASVPASLTVESGRLVVGAAAVFGEGLSLQDGAGLHFAAAGSSAVSIAGLADAEVTVDAALLKRGTVILQSADETLLSALAEKLSPLVEADKEAGLVLSVRPAVDGSGNYRLCVSAKPGLSVILR